MSSSTSAPASDNTSFPKNQIKVLLLERISTAAQQIFINEGYQVESVDKLASEEALIAKIADVHAIGIRSKTNLNANVLKHAKKLLTIGCFCIGTDQTDLEAASYNGTCVFNVRQQQGKRRIAVSRDLYLPALACAHSVALRRGHCAGSLRQHSFGR